MTPYLITLAATFLILHGLVHLLYVAQSQRLFELRPGMAWPADSWALSGLLEERAIATLATVGFCATGFGYALAGVGLFVGTDWWQLAAAAASVLSASIIVLLWHGRLEDLADQGAIGLLIDIAILGAVLAMRYPAT